MACILTAGRELPCKEYSGGVKEVLFIGSNQFYDFKGALTIDGTNDNITAIAGSADTFQAFRYDLKPGAGNTFIETIEANEDGGIAYSQELNISLNGFSNTWRKELILLARNRRLLIAVRDSNENLWLMGYDNGAEVTGGSHDRGAVLSDFTGSKLTFTAMTTKPAYAFAAFTTNPFDNFAAVEVSPSY